MKYNELESINAFKYVTEKNSNIYRPIVRFLYDKRMKLEQGDVMLDDIFTMLTEHEVLDNDYSIANLQDSLKRLEEWEVLSVKQIKKRGMTIAEFKSTKHSYQLTDLGFEIESLLVRIDELDEKLMVGLNSRKFSILYKHLEQLKMIDPAFLSSYEQVSDIWSNVFDTHKELRTNASNYLFRIQDAERANLFNSELFLEFKDNIMQYLGTYISELDKMKFKLIRLISNIDDSHIDKYIEALIKGNKHNSILYEDFTFSEDKLFISLKKKWIELKSWFLGVGGGISDIEILSERTKEAIRLIVGYANRLSDSASNTQNRQNDYQNLAKRFLECNSAKDAHILYGAAFGTTGSRSIHVTEPIEIIESGQYSSAHEIWNTDIKPFKTQNMSNRGPKGISKATTLKNHRIEQQRRIIENLTQKQEDERRVKELFKNGKIVLSEIQQPLEPFQRKVLLKWIMRTSKMRLGKSKNQTFRTETGLTLRVQYRSKELITVPSTDGNLKGYDIEFIIEGESL